VDGYIKGSPKNLAVGLRFKIQTMFGGSGQSPARGFYEVFLNSRLTRVGPDNVGLGVSNLERTWNCLTRLFSLHPTCPS
jgi:hypothetical protein